MIDLRQLQLVCDLPERLANNWGDAAAVMLDKFHSVPPPPTEMRVEHDGASSLLPVAWSEPSSRLREGHANEKDATEDGAYGIAIAAVHHRGFRVRRRAHQGSGADLLMVRRGEPQNEDKVEQAQGGDLRRPGIAVVVGFEAATVKMESTQ